MSNARQQGAKLPYSAAWRVSLSLNLYGCRMNIHATELLRLRRCLSILIECRV